MQVDNAKIIYEALFNHAAIGIILVDDKGFIKAANPFALKLFEYTDKELLGQLVEILLPQKFQKNHYTLRENFVDKPKNRVMGMGYDLYGIKKNGTEFPVEISLSSYTINDEKNVITFITDISVRKKSEINLENLKNELELKVHQRTHELTDALHQLEKSKQNLSKLLKNEQELSELKTRFLSMASHEFKTPLSTVLSSVYLIEKYVTSEDQPKRQKHLQRIISSVNMLTDILNDFLNVGKIEERKIEIRATTFNIKDTVEKIIDEIKNTLKSGQQISYKHHGLEEINMDISLLKHIIMNLISNASKFSFENNKIEITTTLIKKSFKLSVKDQGIGISKEDQKHLMERFFRGTNASNIQGTGLGLSIVANYAKLMNGSLECKSELEEGSEFIITFLNKPNQS